MIFSLAFLYVEKKRGSYWRGRVLGPPFFFSLTISKYCEFWPFFLFHFDDARNFFNGRPLYPVTCAQAIIDIAITVVKARGFPIFM